MEKCVALVSLENGRIEFIGLEDVKKLFMDIGIKGWNIDEKKVSFDEGIKKMLNCGGTDKFIIMWKKESQEIDDNEYSSITYKMEWTKELVNMGRMLIYYCGDVMLFSLERRDDPCG